MKYETTKKAIRQSESRVISVGYGALQFALNCLSPFAYSAGVYGWSCDYYRLRDRNIVISTGYRPIGIHADYNLIKSYEDEARKICERIYDYETRRKVLDSLLADLAGDLEAKYFGEEVSA